jgi:hypothetical protein
MPFRQLSRQNWPRSMLSLAASRLHHASASYFSQLMLTTRSPYVTRGAEQLPAWGGLKFANLHHPAQLRTAVSLQRSNHRDDHNRDTGAMVRCARISHGEEADKHDAALC